MPTPPESRIVPLLDRTALLLAASSVALRWLAIGSMAGPGLNLFLNLLFWTSLGLWFLSRALSGGALYRFTGMEFALLAFVIVCLISALRASFQLVALDQALAMLSYALLFVLAVQVLGRRGILALLVPTVPALAVYGLIQYLLFMNLAIDPAEEELARRVQSHEVFATFIGPNQFAAFLVLALPVLAGRFGDSDRKGNRAVMEGVALLLGLGALFLTGSGGGWVALAAAAAAFAGLALTRYKGRTALVSGGGVLAAAVTTLLLFTPLLDFLAERNHSMYVRSVYWSAAGKIAAEEPLLGAGMDNYQEHYFRVKGEEPQETHRAHNDYLQIMADAGALGLLAFLAILLLGLRQALTTASPGQDPSPPFPPWLFPTAAAIVLLWFGVGAVESFDLLTLMTGIFVVGAWAGYGFLGMKLGPDPSDGAAEWTRIGAAAGLVGLLVHLTVDFDLYVPGVGIALFLGLALVTVLRPGPEPVRLAPAACWISAGLLLIVAVPLLLFVAPGFLAADREIAGADQALQDISAGRLEGPGAAQALGDALGASVSAQENNPIHPEGYALYAQARFFAWDAGRRAGGNDEEMRLRLLETEGAAIQSLENAIRLRPNSARYHELKARYHRAFHFYYRDLRRSRTSDGTPVITDSYAQYHLNEAIKSQEAALALYPTHWISPYNLARLLDLKGWGKEAEKRYREALRLSDRAAGEKWSVRRMQLSPVKRARCLLRTGRQAEARSTLRDYFRKAFDALDPSLKAASLKTEEAKRLFGVGEDEADPILGPLIDEALNEVLN